MAAANPLKLAFIITLWYVLNVQYNLYNKKILDKFPFPYTTSLIQLGCGMLYILPIWILQLGGRKFPKDINYGGVATLSFFHGGGHYATVLSLGAGSVAFANVVKAGEPLCSVIMGILITSAYPSIPQVLTLIPIIVGVMIASMSEPEFSMMAFACAMLSNVLFATRGVLSKPMMKKISGGDLFAINTFFAFAIMAPVTLYMEGGEVFQAWVKFASGKTTNSFSDLLNGVLPAQPSFEYFIAYQVVCGLYYYTYNEMAFMVTDMLDATSQSVANTVKRVVIIVAGSVVFNKPLTTNGILGSAVAMIGVLLYSLAPKAGASKPADAKAKSS
eukprot:CAMPEP_0113682132 /NCGR_PEP_ID=MMETSP0038_2-20120614/12451_1 /TAXON_ID=2898 /ORGANISM="Cryptomonas paramecium" /LENGTH=329 /DNA_ID=CAMNT_0000601083 /DNA_START=75 /DNA_END=1064 /DNA_ORIENTATION=+ /assembly_acc=CAM_ASM_000170